MACHEQAASAISRCAVRGDVGSRCAAGSVGRRSGSGRKGGVQRCREKGLMSARFTKNNARVERN